jgi:hypothetical protein
MAGGGERRYQKATRRPINLLAAARYTDLFSNCFIITLKNYIF